MTSLREKNTYPFVWRDLVDTSDHIKWDGQSWRVMTWDRTGEQHRQVWHPLPEGVKIEAKPRFHVGETLAFRVSIGRDQTRIVRAEVKGIAWYPRGPKQAGIKYHLLPPSNHWEFIWEEYLVPAVSSGKAEARSGREATMDEKMSQTDAVLAAIGRGRATIDLLLDRGDGGIRPAARREYLANVGETLDAARAEVERLRAEAVTLKTAAANAGVLISERDSLRREVERLRAAVGAVMEAAAQDSGQWPASVVAQRLGEALNP